MVAEIFTQIPAEFPSFRPINFNPLPPLSLPLLLSPPPSQTRRTQRLLLLPLTNIFFVRGILNQTRLFVTFAGDDIIG